MAIVETLRTRIRGRKLGPEKRCRRRFLRFFRGGFADEKYFEWERGYKLAAHEQWQEALNRPTYRKLLKSRQYQEIAAIAARIESRTNLLFSFEKMAFRDAVKQPAGAEIFAIGLYDLLYGRGSLVSRFTNWCQQVGKLPRRQTRVLTHPVVTVFPFIANPDEHIFLKPNVTKVAAVAYGYDFHYNSRPSWEVYSQLLGFASTIRKDLIDLQPKDMIDIQSFMWVIGSDEYQSMMPW